MILFRNSFFNPAIVVLGFFLMLSVTVRVSHSAFADSSANTTAETPKQNTSSDSSSTSLRGSGASKKWGGRPVPPVVLREVERRSLEKKLWFSGSIISRHHASLASENEGRIVNIVEIGSHLVAGDTVAQQDDTLLKQTLAEHSATISSLAARIRFLEKEHYRLSSLAKDSFVAVNKMEENQSNLEIQRHDLAASKARYAQVSEHLRRLHITAPFAGVISERHAEVGEWLKKGEHVADIVSLDDLEIEVSVTSQVLPFIFVNQRLDIDVQSVPHVAIVHKFVPVGDARSHQFVLRLTPVGDVGLPNQSVRVAVPISSAFDSLVVPEDALIIRHNGTRVFAVTEDFIARSVPVTTGLSNQDGFIAIEGDLSAGDKVVIRGGERLRDGMAVRAISSAIKNAPATDNHP